MTGDPEVDGLYMLRVRPRWFEGEGCAGRGSVVRILRVETDWITVEAMDDSKARVRRSMLAELGESL